MELHIWYSFSRWMPDLGEGARISNAIISSLLKNSLNAQCEVSKKLSKKYLARVRTEIFQTVSKIGIDLPS
jgi:hypothetical protein